MTPHKWAKEIKAWADGAKIQWRNRHQHEWLDVSCPMWMTNDDFECRVKPELKTPSEVFLAALRESNRTLSPSDLVEVATLAVIEAYNRGELKL